MKEIVISDPKKVLRFYESQRNTNVISDSSLSDMISLNKLEVGYVIPIDKEKRVSVKQNTSVNIIDPNAAAVNQAKENIKNDSASSQQVMSVTNRDGNTRMNKHKRKSTDSSQTCSQSKKSKNNRRKTIVNGDIFGED